MGFNGYQGKLFKKHNLPLLLIFKELTLANGSPRLKIFKLQAALVIRGGYIFVKSRKYQNRR
jgi:hypothetical protein